MENKEGYKRDWTGFLIVFLAGPILAMLMVFFAIVAFHWNPEKTTLLTPIVAAFILWVIACSHTYPKDPNEKDDDCDCDEAEDGVLVSYFASNPTIAGSKKMKSDATIPELPKVGEIIALTDVDQDSDKYFEAKVTGVLLASNQTTDGSDYIITVEVTDVEKLKNLNWEDMEEQN